MPATTPMTAPQQEVSSSAATTPRQCTGSPLWFTATVAASGMLAIYALFWLNITPSQQRQTGFSVFYSAAMVIRHGLGAQLYNQALEATQHTAILLPGHAVSLARMPFLTPPTSALIALPFSLLGPSTGYWAFSSLQILLLVVAASISVAAAPREPDRSRPFNLVLIALAGGGTWLVAYFGQSDGFCVLGLALAYLAWRRDRPLLAGLCLAASFGLVKPHLAIGLLAFILGRRDWKATGGFLLGAIAIVAVSVAALGASTTVAFLGNLANGVKGTPLSSNVGIFGVAERLAGQNGTAMVIAAPGMALAVLAAFMTGVWSRGRPETLELALLGVMSLSLVVAPHFLAYDSCLLIPPFLCMVCRVRATPAQYPNLNDSTLLAAWVVLTLLVLAYLFNWASIGGTVGEWAVPLGFLAVGIVAAARTRTMAQSPATP